jgi:DNA primase
MKALLKIGLSIMRSRLNKNCHFPSELLERIRKGNDLVKVVSDQMPTLNLDGNIYATNCPFHDDESTSLHVNTERQIYHCFGCHRGGDVFTFVKEHENISFVEAVRRLAKRAGISLETP